MPDVRIAEAVGVRIAREDVWRDVAGEIPLAIVGRQGQINRREVARVIAVARADDQRNQIARLHRDILERADVDHFRAL
ncbi:MAG: hypothetical protein FD138_1816 [Planctomycetota bacterium]|nr:MAG: hypothetical protein FD138_1816 [Planctomycetota bacterium]